MDDERVLIVDGRYEHIQQICQFVATGAAASGLNDADIFHVELACDEACTNIIEHAYGAEGEGKIKIRWQVEGEMFTVTIEDNGRSFAPEEVPTPPLVETPDVPDDVQKLKVGGLGIHFMRKLMDDVQFHFDETGNTLVMKKKIEVGEGDA